MHSTPDTQAAQTAKRLRDKVARFHSGFKRQYPLLIDFVDGLRPLEDCSMGYYREKVRAHLELVSQMTREAARLERSIQAGETRR